MHTCPYIYIDNHVVVETNLTCLGHIFTFSSIADLLSLRIFFNVKKRHTQPCAFDPLASIYPTYTTYTRK